jgi:hypothetical protein
MEVRPQSAAPPLEKRKDCALQEPRVAPESAALQHYCRDFAEECGATRVATLAAAATFWKMLDPNCSEDCHLPNPE